MSFKIGVPALPSGYTQLEYIEGNGTQYINTSFVPTKNHCDVDIMLESPDMNFNHGYFVGEDRFSMRIRNNSPTDKIVKIKAWDNEYDNIEYDNKLHVHAFYVGVQAGNDITQIIVRDEISSSSYMDCLDEQIEGNLGTSFFEGNTSPMIILSNGTAHSAGKIYSYKHSEEGTLKINLIPAKRNSDSVVGMYDTVSNTFLINAASGGTNFIAGPEVSGGLVYKDIDSLRINSNGSYKRLTGLYKKDPASSGYIQIYSKTYIPYPNPVVSGDIISNTGLYEHTRIDDTVEVG